ncbi:kinase domain protein (macronuclear) [Tetrahymena thermophila SB210]|uniref:Kinase domain protein n=1 Tax=Tetrahymena thermophila (strain SB210) TaxID=312017 RepID=I7M005_TETTS|nr:kinase domain protein [Tetrahymena thermophila SB210]EAR85247.2 kinase domain protein [Tetrahymena thermophila SB210]|eukprot:XP_001032910.2 kinase domain protein [Tetrahymena thermophila SB210]
MKTAILNNNKNFYFSRRLTLIQNKIVVYTQIPSYNDDKIVRIQQDIDYIREDRVQQSHLSIGKLRYIVSEQINRVRSIEDAFSQIIALQQQPEQRSISIQFYLAEICSQISEKQINQRNSMRMQRLIFQDCSSELIEEVVKFFYSAEWRADRVNRIEYILFKNCYINDFKLIKLIQRFDYFYSQRFESASQKNKQDSTKQDDELISFSNVEILIDNCPNITSYFLSYLENWTIVQNALTNVQSNYLTDFTYERVKNFNQNTKLAIKDIQNDLSHIDLLKFSTTIYFKYLASLKLKNITSAKPTILKEMLSSKFQPKFKESDAENQSYSQQNAAGPYCSKLQVLSVDTTVCDSFDSLPLHEEYWAPLRKLSFENRSEDSNEYHDITFPKMVSYSLFSLQILKLKRCNLTAEFFQIFAKMDCVQNVRQLSFERCKIDLKAFKTFLYHSKITENLQYLNLTNTNITDDVCFIISEQFSNKMQLKGIDVSRCTKISQKGIKYLTLITSLRQLNIEYLENAVTDSFSYYIVDLLLKKQKKFYETFIEDDQVQMLTEIDKQRENQIQNTNHYQNVIYELQKILDKKIQEEKKEQQPPPLVNVAAQKSQNDQGDKDKDKEKEKEKKEITAQMVILDSSKAQALSITQLKAIQAEIVLIKEKEIQQIKDTYNQKREEIKLQFKEKRKNYLKNIKQLLHYEDLPTINYLNLNKNTKVTSVFLDLLDSYGFLNRLSLLSVQDTMVNGHIFKILQKKPQITESKVQEESNNNENKKQEEQKQINKQVQQEIIPTNPNFTEKGDLKPIIEDEKGDHTSQKPSTASAAEGINNTNLQNTPFKEDSEKQLIIKKESNDDVAAAAEVVVEKQEDDDKKKITVNNSLEQRRLQQQNIKRKILNMTEQQKNQKTEVKKVKTEPDNYYLKYLDLTGCNQIYPDCFEILFDTYFENLEVLKLVQVNYYDNQFLTFTQNVNNYFKKLKILNLAQSQINRSAISVFFSKVNIPLVEINMNQCKVDEVCIQSLNNNLKENLIKLSLSQCFLYDSQHLQDLLNLMKKNVCFDYNYILKQYNHLISKKMLYEIVRNYPPLENQHVLDLTEAAFCDIDVTYWNHNMRYQDQKINQFSKLEALIVDDTRIDFDLLFMILRQHCNIYHISCKNTPNFKMKRYIENKSTKKVVQVGFEQMAQVLNDKSLEFQEGTSWINFISSKFKKKHTRYQNENIVLNLRFQQIIQKQRLRSLIDSYKDLITRINFENSKIDDNVLENISSGAKTITRLYIKGCNNITKAGLIRLSESKKLSPKFDLECILELKHLIDMEVMQSIAQSPYLKNIVYLDFSNLQLSNIDDGIMKICLSSSEVLLNIRILDISNTWTSDRGLQIISVTQKLRKLEKIYYSDCKKITERGIAYILDSGTLERLDISHFIGQSPDKFNGKVLDNLKYSNRKAFFRELNFQDSLFVDKELNNMFYDISKMFNIKYLDLRRTPNIGDEGLKLVHQIQLDQFQILLLDFYRYDKLIPSQAYIDAVKKIEQLQLQNISSSEKAVAQKVANLAVNENPNQKQGKDNKNQQNQQQIESDNIVYSKTSLLQYPPFQFTYQSNGIEEYEERRKKMKSLYNFEKVQPKQITDTNIIQILRQDNFFLDIFINNSKIREFRYDFFIFKHSHLFEDNIIFSLGLSKFCDYHKKNTTTRLDNKVPERNPQKEQTQDLNFKNQLRQIKYMKYLDLSNATMVSNKAFCILFMNFELLSIVEHINLSNTQIDEDVILSISASYQMTNLKTLLFDNCQQLKDISTAFIYIVLGSKKNQMILKNSQNNNSFNYIKQMDQVNQASNNNAVNNKNQQNKNNQNNDQSKNKENEEKNKEETFLNFDYYGFFQYYSTLLNAAAINLFLKIHSMKQKQDEKLSNQKGSVVKSRHIYGLNLEGCQLKGISQLQIPKEIMIINLAQTNIDYPDLKLFLPFTKYLWIDQTFNIKDENFAAQIQPMLDQIQERFVYTEFLNSKSYSLNKGAKLIIHILEKFDIKYLDLTHFRQISHTNMKALLSNEKICNKLRSLKIDFRQLHHVKLLNNILDTIYRLCEKDQLFQLQIDKILLDQQYKKFDKDFTVEESTMKKIRDKIVIDSNITKGFPFIGHPFKQSDYNKNEEEQTIKNYFEFVYQPFQIQDLRLGGMNITKNQVQSLLNLLQQGNQLRKLALDELPFVNDDFVIENLIKTVSVEHTKEIRPFEYLQILTLSKTRVTERCFINILNEIPFSINFKLSLLLESLQKEQNFTFTNYTLEALSQSKYLLNITNLDTSNFDYVSHILCKLFDSKYAVNIQTISLNYKLLNEQVFIKLASTKMLPNLIKIDLTNCSKCNQFFHYMIRAKYINIRFSIKDIVEEPGIISCTPFLLSIIDSTYMQQIQTLTIDNIDHDINQLEQIFQVSNYLFNLKNLSINIQRDSTSNQQFWTSIADSNKIPQLEQLSVKKLITSNLKIMIQQKWKPRVQIDKLLYDNQEYLDDECLAILSEQPHLINITEIDLSKLNVSKRDISSTTLLKLFLSKYCTNIQKIILGEDKLEDRSKIGIEQDLVATEYIAEYLREQKKLFNEAEFKLIDIQIYKAQENSKNNTEEQAELKKEGLYEKFLMFNNLKNLKEIQFLSKELLNKRYLYLISKKSLHKMFSTQFDFGLFIYQLTDLFFQLKDDLYSFYTLIYPEIDLHGWFQQRQKVLYLDFFQQFLGAYDAINQVIRRVEDFSCIEEIRFQSKQNTTFALHYMIYCESWGYKPAFLNLQKITISFQLYKRLDISTSSIQQVCNFFNRPFMQFKLFECGHFLDLLLTNINLDSISSEYLMTRFYVASPFFIQQIQDMVFYTDQTCPINILQDIFNLPYLNWRSISIRARGKDRDENQITQEEKEIQNKIINLIITKGYLKLKHNIDSLELVSKISFEQYYDLEINNVLSKSFNRQEFIEKRVDLSTLIRPNQVMEMRKNNIFYYSQYTMYIPSMKQEEKKKKPEKAVQQNTNAVSQAPANNNQQQQNQHDKSTQQSQIQQGKNNQQKNNQQQKDQGHQKQGDHSQIKQQDAQQQQQQNAQQNQSEAPQEQGPPESYLQQFQLHRMTKLNKLVIKANLEWVDFVYLYEKIMVNNPGLNVQFESRNHKPMIEYIRNTNREGKDWSQEIKYIQQLFSDDKEKKKEQIIQAIVSNESAKYFLLRLDQNDKNSKVPFTNFLFNAFKAFRTGLDTEIKEIGPTQAQVQNQTKQQFNTPNNNNTNNNNNNNKNNNQKQNNNAVNNKNQNTNQQNNNAVVVNNNQEQNIISHPISAKKKKKPLSIEFYVSQVEYLDTIDYSKEQEFLNSFPCLLEITFDKYEKSNKINEKFVENTLSLLQICRNPITIQNIFNILAPCWQQKHLKQINSMDFVKSNVFYISFKNNNNIQIKGVEDRKINNLEENQLALDKVQSQFVKENNEVDQNENQNQIGDDNINLQNLKSGDEKSDILSRKSSEKGDPLLKKSMDDFEDYDQEIQKNVAKNQQNENYNQEEKKEDQKGQEEDKDNEEENKFQEEKGKNKNRVFINEKDLSKFLRLFQNLQELDFSQSSISKEHFQICFQSLKNNINLNCVVIQGCEVADPEGYLVSVLQFLQESHIKGQKSSNQQNKSQGKKKRHFQLERFIQSISFEINTVMNLKFIKTLIQSNHFIQTIKFLKLTNLFNAYAQSSELKQIILPFLQSQNLDTSAFLQQNDIQSQIDDDLIVELTKQKDNIGYISPDTFINVKYGFNLLLQQKCIDFDEKLLYFLNTSFQKSLSGTSFYEVYQFIHDQNMLKNSYDYIQSMDKDLFNLVKIYVERNEYYLQQTQKFMNQKDPVFVDTSYDETIFEYIQDFLKDNTVRTTPKSEFYRQTYFLTLEESKQKYITAKKRNKKYYEDLENQKQYNEIELKNTNKLTIEVIRNKSFKDYQKDKERFILKFSRYSNHLMYLIDQYKKKMENLIKQESRQIFLLDFIENLNLKNNSFFNYSGLNNYITNHITPWLKLNSGISKIKESKNLRSTKVIDESSAQKDSAYSKLISPDHNLDDKILLHLLFIIEQDLNNLRSIELIGLNVSDLFAQRLSNVLSDSYKLQKLMLLDLSNNNRLTSYGMKYIYSSIVDRVQNGLNIILTSNKQEMESIELILEDILERIDLIKEFISERAEQAEQQKQNTPIQKNIFQAISIQKKGSLEKLELLDNKKENIEDQIDQHPPQDLQQEEAQINQDIKPNENQENKEEKKDEEKQEVGLIRQSAPKQQEKKIDSVKLYGWKPLEDPLTEELNYLEQKYEKYMELYKQCQKEVSELGEQAQIASSEVIAQSLVNVGFYEFVNRQIARKWKEGKRFLVIFLAIFFFVFTILQFTLFICFEIEEYIVKKYELRKLKKQSQFTFSKEGQLQIKVIKKVPLILQQDDFYFDIDILLVNYILGCTSFTIEENEERQRLLRIQKFLKDPCQQNKHLISKQKERKSQFYTLTYAFQILIVTYFVYLIGFILISTILQIYTPLTDSCNSLNIYWDVAFYIYCIFAITLETLLCLDVQYLVGSKKICNISYFSLMLRLFFSFILKYDQYTDIQFSIFLYNCQEHDLKKFGIVQACFILCSLFKDFIIVCQYLQQLYRDRSEHDYEQLPNTYFINLFTGLALSIQMNAFSKLLEKFSTVGLSYINIRVPFEFLHLLWRIFFANIPTIFIYFYIFIAGIGSFDIASWADQRIFVTSILSFCYCVHQAWVTKPSNFTSYQMKENLEFVSMQEELYSLKIRYENKITYYSYDELFKKLKVFIEINQLIYKQDFQNFNKQSLQKLQQQQEDQKNNVIDSQKNLVSQANIQSARDLWNDYDQFEDSQQADILSNDTKSKEFQEKIKALEEKQNKDFSQYQDNLLRFLIYKKLNWEQFNQRGLFKGSGEKEEQNEIDKKTQFSNKEDNKQN